MLSRSVEVRKGDGCWVLGDGDMKGGRAASEPVAMMIFGAVYSSLPMMTVWSSLNCALPLTKVMPGCESSVSTPVRNCSTTCCLRATIAGKSTSNCRFFSPLVSVRCRLSMISAWWQNVLVGMHPQFRQVPPTSSASAITTCRPFLAAYSAARYPPGPAPMMIKSVFMIWFFY